METVCITKVAILTDGRLAVYPATVSPWYEYIYREAAGVYWNPDLGCFQSTPPQDWDSRQWFMQIVSVVRTGLGIRLDLMADTDFSGLQESFKADIISANAEVQRWICEQERKQHGQEQIRLSQQRFDEAEHHRLAYKATEAFHRQDYRTVVDILSNVKCALTDSEKAKLAYARKQLRS